MKIYISVDMEGMAGITQPSEEKNERERFRQALHDQLSWIIEGIHQSPKNDTIEEITISDSHGDGINLSYGYLSQLDDRISLVSGSPRKHFMMSCLDDSYDVVFFAGYHAGPGEAHACMDHCYSGKVVHAMYINDIWQNESTCNAALAAHYGVPVGLVTGDSGLRRQLIDEERMPWVEYVTTKESLSRYSVKHLPQRKLRQDTIDAVIRTLDKDLTKLPLYKVEEPCRLKFHFNNTAQADMVAQVPGTIREDGRTVSIVCRDMVELECGVSALTAIAGLG